MWNLKIDFVKINYFFGVKIKCTFWYQLNKNYSLYCGQDNTPWYLKYWRSIPKVIIRKNLYPWGLQVFLHSCFSFEQCFQFHQICTTYDYWRQTFAPERLQESKIENYRKTPVFSCLHNSWVEFLSRAGVMTDPTHVINQPTIPTNTDFHICKFCGIPESVHNGLLTGGQVHLCTCC